MFYQCSLFLYHTSDLSDHEVVTHQVYTRGWVLHCSRFFHSAILSVFAVILEGSKSAKFGLSFDPSCPSATLVSKRSKIRARQLKFNTVMMCADNH